MAQFSQFAGGPLMSARRHTVVGTAWVVAIGAAFDATAHAQGGERLNGKDIAALISGKTIVYRTDRFVSGTRAETRVVKRNDGGQIEIALYIRSDGSYRFRCTNISRNGEQSPCPRAGPDVGTWEIRGDTVCVKQFHRDGLIQCFEYYRAGARHRMRQVSGTPATSDGVVFDVRDPT
jgi:hypothetical protein